MERTESLDSGPAHMREQVSFGLYVPDTATSSRLESAGGPLLEQTSSFFNIGEDPFASVPGTSSLMPQQEHAQSPHHNHTSSSDVQRLLDEINLAATYAQSAQRVVRAEAAQGSNALHTQPGEQELFQAPTLTDGLASGVHNGISQHMEQSDAAATMSGGSSSPSARVRLSTASDEGVPRRRTLGDGPLPAGYMGATSSAATAGAETINTLSIQSYSISYSAPTELLAPVPEHADGHSSHPKLPIITSDGPTTSDSTQQQAHDPYSPQASNTHSSSSSQDQRPTRPTISADPAPSAPAVLSPVDARLHAPRSRRSSSDGPPRQRRRSTGELLLPSYKRLTADALSPGARSSSRRSTLDDVSRRSMAELGLASGSSITALAALSSPRQSSHGRMVQVPGGLSLEAIEAALGPRSAPQDMGSARQLPATEGLRGAWAADAGKSVDQVGMLAAAMAALRGGDGAAAAQVDVAPKPRRSSTREIKTAFDLMQGQIAKLEQTNMELQERIIMVQTALAESQAALAEAQSNAIAAGRSKQQLEDQIRHLTAKVRGGEHQVEFLSKQLDAQQQQLRLSADALAAKGHTTSTLEAEVGTLKERIAELNREVDAGKKKITYEAEEARRAAAEAAAVKRDNQGLQDSLNKARTEVSELKDKLASSQAEMSRRVAELSGQAGGLDEQLQDIHHVATGLDVKCTQLEATNAQLSAQLAAAEGARAALRQQLEAARAAASAANAVAAAATAAAYAPVQYMSPPPHGEYGSAAVWQSPPLHQQYRQPANRPADYASQYSNGHISGTTYNYRPAEHDTGHSSYTVPREEQLHWQHQQQQQHPLGWSPSPPPSPPPQYMRAEAPYQPPQPHQQLHGSPDPPPTHYQQLQQQQHSQPYYASHQPGTGGRPSTAAAGPLARSYDTPPWFGAAGGSRPADLRSSLQLPSQQSSAGFAGPSTAGPSAAWERQQQQQQQAYHQPPPQWSAAQLPARERSSSAGPSPSPYAVGGDSSSAQPGWQGPTSAPLGYNQTTVPPATAYDNGTAAQQPGYRATPSPVRTSSTAGPSPFGTDLTLGQLMATTKQLEDALLALSRERDELESEFAKMPLHGGRTLRERQRKVEVEARLEELRKEISNTRLQLKRLGH